MKLHSRSVFFVSVFTGSLMAEKSGCLLIQFAERPLPGRVKPRLIPALGVDAATQVHLAVMAHVLETLAGSGLGTVELWLDKMPTMTDQYPPQFFEMAAACKRAEIELRVQIGVDRGEKLYQALASGLADFGYVILVGSDCAVLDRAYLREALNLLEAGEDVVFGPAEGGGFVLVGARRLHPHMFTHVPWGEAAELQCALANCSKFELQAACLEPRWKIDNPADLARWQKLIGPGGA